MNKLDKKLILNIVIMLTVCTTTKAMPISVGTDSVEKADSLPRRHHDLAMTLNKKTGDKVMAYLNMGFLGSTNLLHGVQLNAMTSLAHQEMRGLQCAGLSNIGTGIKGVQLAGFSNVSLSSFRGIQIGGVTNISRGVEKGIQLTALANISSSYMRGLQIGAYNYADTLNGSQIGLFNACISHPRGVQIGLLNYSRDTTAHKIGLVNINPLTRIDVMAFGGNSNI